jgi:hypothetical protein
MIVSKMSRKYDTLKFENTMDIKGIPMVNKKNLEAH